MGQPTTDDQGLWWGIRSRGPGITVRQSHWTEADAVAAAAYNSERWGPYDVAPPLEPGAFAIEAIRDRLSVAVAAVAAAERHASELAAEGVAAVVLRSYPTAATLMVSEWDEHPWSLTAHQILDAEGNVLATSRDDHELFLSEIHRFLVSADDHHFRDIFAGKTEPGAIAFKLIDP